MKIDINQIKKLSKKSGRAFFNFDKKYKDLAAKVFTDFRTFVLLDLYSTGSKSYNKKIKDTLEYYQKNYNYEFRKELHDCTAISSNSLSNLPYNLHKFYAETKNKLYVLLLIGDDKSSVILEYKKNSLISNYIRENKEIIVANYIEYLNKNAKSSFFNENLVSLFFDTDTALNHSYVEENEELGFTIFKMPPSGHYTESVGDIVRNTDDGDNVDYIHEGMSINEFIYNNINDLSATVNKSTNITFDPNKGFDPEVQAFSDYLGYKRDFNLFTNQKNIINAMHRHLKKEKAGFLISQPGTGKTSMAISVASLWKNGSNKNVFVVCPTHLIKKWSKDINILAPNAKIYECNSTKEYIEHIEPEINKRLSTNYILVNPNCIKQSVVKTRSTSIDCLKHVKNVLDKGKKETIVKVDGRNEWMYINYLKIHSKSEHKKGEHEEVIRYRDFLEATKVKACASLIDTKKIDNKNTMSYNIDQIVNAIDINEQRAANFASLDWYIQRKGRHNVDMLIVDEMHEFLTNSAQGHGVQRLASCAKKILGLTGTLFNGYAENLYNMFLYFYPEKIKNEYDEYMKRDPDYRGGMKKQFKDRYSYKEVEYTPYEYQLYKLENAIDYTYINHDWGRYLNVQFREKNKLGNTSTRVECTTKTKDAPGINPNIFIKLLSNCCVFMSMDDVSSELPAYNESIIKCELNKENLEAYNGLIGNLSNAIVPARYKHQEIKKLAAWSNNPCFIADDYIEYRGTGVRDNHKLDELMNIINHHDQECVLVYTYYDSNNDINSIIYDRLQQEGIKTAILKSSTSAMKRIEWFEKKKEEGVRVVICNPGMVDTGLDLLDFTTIVFYELDQNFFTMRQAARRSYRLNQKNNVSIYYMYYAGTVQETLIKFMAEKLKSVKVLEGDFDDEGLSSLVSGNQDNTNAIYKDMLDKVEYQNDDDVISINKYADKVEKIVDMDSFKLERIVLVKKPLKKQKINLDNQYHLLLDVRSRLSHNQKLYRNENLYKNELQNFVNNF